MADYHKDITFAKLEMEGQDDLGMKYNIEVYPTFKLYHNQKELSSVIGANNEKLRTGIDKLQLS